MNNKKLNPHIPGRISDELWDKSIGKLNANLLEYSAEYKNCIIHMIDSVSRGYTSKLEAYEALNYDWFPEYLTVRDSAYSHLMLRP